MTNPNDLAFSTNAEHEYSKGLTKREYFAVMAMQGMAANPVEYPMGPTIRTAVEWADALIAELNK